MVSPDGMAPRRMVGMSASVDLPLHHKIQNSLLAPAHPSGPGKRAVKWLWCPDTDTQTDSHSSLIILYGPLKMLVKMSRSYAV